MPNVRQELAQEVHALMLSTPSRSSSFGARSFLTRHPRFAWFDLVFYVVVFTALPNRTALARQNQTQPSAAQSPAATSPPVAYASISELNSILGQLKQTTTSMQTDLDRVRIEKWKTDNGTKRQTQANIDSIQRNLQSALPDITSQLTASPEDLSTSFKLYRNLDALYDVFGSVVESAGAFGSKDDFQNLSNDMNGLESARRSFGERMQRLAGAKEDELTHLRAQVKTLTAAPPPPPKKIIIDDTEEAPQKTPPKKKSTKPKPGNPPSTTPPNPSGESQNQPPNQ